jgi:serine/threonine protein kinase
MIIKQILQGLEHLSYRRIIHRDLKPENIMFKQEGSLELGICDFGLATYAD